MWLATSRTWMLRSRWFTSLRSSCTDKLSAPHKSIFGTALGEHLHSFHHRHSIHSWYERRSRLLPRIPRQPIFHPRTHRCKTSRHKSPPVRPTPSFPLSKPLIRKPAECGSPHHRPPHPQTPSPRHPPSTPTHQPPPSTPNPPSTPPHP